MSKPFNNDKKASDENMSNRGNASNENIEKFSL